MERLLVRAEVLLGRLVRFVPPVVGREVSALVRELAQARARRRHAIEVDWGRTPTWACTCGFACETAAQMSAHLAQEHGV